jgi:hypothetical protein
MEIGKVDLLLDLADLLLAVMLAPVKHPVHVEVHIVIQVRRVEVHLLLNFAFIRLLLLPLSARLHHHPILLWGLRGPSGTPFQNLRMAKK